MQSIDPIHNHEISIYESKDGKRKSSSISISKNLINTCNLKHGDIIYLYTKDAHDKIQNLQINYNKLNENMKFIKAETDNDAKKYKDLYDNVSAELEKVKKELVDVKSDKNDLINELADAQSKYNRVKSSLNDTNSKITKLQKELDNTSDYNNRITELEHELKITNNKLSNVGDDINKAKQNVLDADNAKSELREQIKIKDNTIEERTKQLNQMKADNEKMQDKYDAKILELTDKYNADIKSKADKIASLTAGIYYLDDVLSNKNKIIRKISGLDKPIEIIKKLKDIKASEKPKAINTIKYYIPEDV